MCVPFCQEATTERDQKEVERYYDTRTHRREEEEEKVAEVRETTRPHTRVSMYGLCIYTTRIYECCILHQCDILLLLQRTISLQHFPIAQQHESRKIAFPFLSFQDIINI